MPTFHGIEPCTNALTADTIQFCFITVVLNAIGSWTKNILSTSGTPRSEFECRNVNGTITIYVATRRECRNKVSLRGGKLSPPPCSFALGTRWRMCALGRIAAGERPDCVHHGTDWLIRFILRATVAAPPPPEAAATRLRSCRFFVGESPGRSSVADRSVR